MNNMISHLISVIVPVYNTEKYLDECVQSILNQSFTDFELLLIDDGSTDRSGAICDQYAAKDERVRVFHTENGGVSSARNVGLDEAKGEWIAFVDSDDWVSSKLLECLYSEAEKGKHDLVFCNYAEVYKGQTVVSQHLCCTSKRDYINGIIEGLLGSYLWNKLIHRNLFSKTTKFYNGYDLWEDLQMSVQLFFYAESVCALDTKPLYFHNCTNIQSITSSKGKNKINSMVQNLLSIEQFLEDHEIIDISVLDNRKIYCKMAMLGNGIDAEYWRNTFPELNESMLKRKGIPLKYKVVAWLANNQMDTVYQLCQSVWMRLNH